MSSNTAHAIAFEVTLDSLATGDERSSAATNPRAVALGTRGMTADRGQRDAERAAPSTYPVPAPPPPPERECTALYKRRAILADKSARGEATGREEIQLRYLDWQIDRIEMAELAPAFAQLEGLARLQRDAAQALQDLVGAAERARRR